MVTQELFYRSSATPADAYLHGKQYIEAVTTETWSFRRGVDISASADFIAMVDRKMGHTAVSAGFAADLEAHVAVAVQIMSPLDLFGPQGAGLVARIAAEAELSAAIGLDVSVSVADILQAAKVDLGGPLAEMLDAIAEELELSAGIWVRAAFAAEAQLSATATGRLRPGPREGAGLTFSTRAAAGFGFGAGLEFMLNVGFPSPHQLCARLGEAVTDAVLGAASKESTKALAAARLLLPLGVQSLLELGWSIADPPKNGHSTSDVVIDALLSKLQSLVLDVLLHLAADEIGRLLGPGNLLSVVLEMPDTDREHAAAVFDGLADAVGVVAATQVSAPEKFLGSVAVLLARAEDLVDLPVVPPDLAKPLRRALATAWSALMLLARVESWVADPARAASDLFGTTPVTGSGAIVAEIPKRGNALTYADLVVYLVRPGDITRALNQVPVLREPIKLVAGFCDSDVGALATAVLLDASHSDYATAMATLAQLVQPVIDDLLQPILTSPTTDPLVVEMISGVVEPLLQALPTVVAPAVAQADRGGDDRIRSGEAVAALLLYLISRTVLHVARQAEITALAAADASLQRLSAQLVTDGMDSPALNEIRRNAPLLDLREDDLADIVALARTVVVDLSRSVPETLDAVATAIDLGLADAVGRREAVSTILTSDLPVPEADLPKMLDRSVQDALTVTSDVMIGSFNVFARYLERRIKRFGEALNELMKQMIKTILKTIDEIEAGVINVANRIIDLGHSIEAWLGDIADAVSRYAARLREILGEVLARVRELGHAEINRIVAEPLRPLATTIFDTTIDGLVWLENHLLGAMQLGADAASVALHAAADSGQVSRSAVDDHAHATIIAAAGTQHLEVSLAQAGAPSIVLGGGSLAASAMSAVRADAAATTALNDGWNSASSVNQATRERKSLEESQTQSRWASATRDELTQSTPRGTLTAEIDTQDGRGATIVTIRLKGDLTTRYVDPALPLPSRLLIKVNDVPVALDPQGWSPGSSGDIETSFLLVIAPTSSKPALRLVAPADVAVLPISAFAPITEGVAYHPQTPLPPAGSAFADGLAANLAAGYSATHAGYGDDLLATTGPRLLFALPRVPARAGINYIELVTADGFGQFAHTARPFSLTPGDDALHARIRDRAYAYFQKRGSQPGHALDDWLAAQAEILPDAIRTTAYYRWQARGGQSGDAVNDWLTAEDDVYLSLLGVTP